MYNSSDSTLNFGIIYWKILAEKFETFQTISVAKVKMFEKLLEKLYVKAKKQRHKFESQGIVLFHQA